MAHPHTLFVTVIKLVYNVPVIHVHDKGLDNMIKNLFTKYTKVVTATHHKDKTISVYTFTSSYIYNNFLPV